MKNLSIAVLGMCCMLCNLCSSGQVSNVPIKVPLNEPDYNKPKLFADLPDRVNFNPGNLSNLFDLQVGQSANIPVSPGVNFSGQVVSKSDDLKSASVVVRLTNRLGARFVFTKITDSDNTIKYIGRIISLQHGDSYEIVSENNQYYFKKQGLYDLIAE
jgi:hypothetical protein